MLTRWKCDTACTSMLHRSPAPADVGQWSFLNSLRDAEPLNMNVDEIKACIPHRPPFLWLDEVTEISADRIVAIKYLSKDLPVFQGHYPDFPVFPGVLQCEACFQAGAVLISKLISVEDAQVPVVTRQNNTQFRRLIRPDETIQMEVSLTERLSNAFYLKGRVSVSGKITARLEFVCTTTAVK